jgi:hypothetical protein
MADNWYVGRNGQRSGPFTTPQVRQMAASGELKPSEMVWKEGMANWVAASTIKEFFTNAPSAVNPYAAPDTAISDGGGAKGPTPPGDLSGYSFSAAADLTMRTVKARWGLLVLVGLTWLGAFIAMAIPQWGLQMIGIASGDEGFSSLMSVAGSCFGFVLNILVGGPLLAGFFLSGAKAVAGEGQVTDLFVGFRRYGSVLLAHLLVLAVMFGVTLLSYIPLVICVGLAAVVSNANGGNDAALPVILSVVGLLATIAMLLAGTAFVGMRVGFAPALVADHELGTLGVMEAVRLNWARVSSQKGLSLIGLLLVVMLIAMFSLGLCCIGYVLLGMPVMIAAAGSAYTLLFKTAPQPRLDAA